MTTMRAIVHEVAAPQHGVFTTWQLGQRGVPRRAIQSLRRSSEIVSLHQGVHRIAAAPDSFESRVVAALLACGPESEAAAAQLTALQVIGIRRAFQLEGTPAQVHVVVQDTTPREIPGVVVHRTVDLGYGDVVEINGIRCTTGERSIIDLQPVLDETDHTALIDDTICARAATRGRLYREATRLQPGRPGLQRVRELTHPEAAGIFRSWLEREFHQQVIVAHGLPVPDYNVRVYDEDGLIGIVDAKFPDHPVIAEMEGLRFHTTPSQRKRDAERFNRLNFSPYRALRYTWRDVVERPEYVAAQLRKALRLSDL